MAEYPVQIVVDDALWDFMEYCEIYCGGACCGIDAYEIHHGLLIRKSIDWNISDRSGEQKFNKAWGQLKELVHAAETTAPQAVNGQIAVWRKGGEEGWPAFVVDADDVIPWLHKWEEAFTAAAKHVCIRTRSKDKGST
ncbi:MAG: DUF6331 family protein [Phycisphaerae bacterium]|nr:DUF6331 family protein [Phycisphaerae bacterium]